MKEASLRPDSITTYTYRAIMKLAFDDFNKSRYAPPCYFVFLTCLPAHLRIKILKHAFACYETAVRETIILDDIPSCPNTLDRRRKRR